MNTSVKDVIPRQTELPAIDPALTIYAKLLAARNKFHKVKLVKTGHNTFTGGRYFELEDFLPFALEYMTEQGLLPLISFTTEYATMTIYDVSSSDSIVVTSPMSTAKLKSCHEVQNLGAVESYIRRYLWIVVMEVMEGEPVEQSKPTPEPATPEQISALYDYAETDLMTDGQKMWLEKANDKITSEQAERALEKLREIEAAQDD